MGPARRPAVLERPHPLRAHPQQDPQGHRRQVAHDGGLPHAVRARLGHARPADRARRRARAQGQAQRDVGRRLPPRVPRLRDEVRRHPARGVQAAGRARRLGPAVPHARSVVRGRDRVRARHVRAWRLPVPRQEAGLVVPARQDRARRGRDRVPRSQLAQRLRAVPARRGLRRQAGGARDLDDDPVDAPREPRDRGAPAVHVRRDPEPARSGRVADRREGARREVRGRDRRRGSDERHRDQPRRDEGARGCALPAPARRRRPGAARAAARRRVAGWALPAVVRGLRHHRGRYGPRPHRARPRRGRLQDRHGARVARVRAARRPRALRAWRRDRRRRGAVRQVDRGGEPDHRGAPRGGRLPPEPGDRQGQAQLSALLAVQAADRVPCDAAVVPQDGPRRLSHEGARSGHASGSTR